MDFQVGSTFQTEMSLTGPAQGWGRLFAIYAGIRQFFVLHGRRTGIGCPTIDSGWRMSKRRRRAWRPPDVAAIGSLQGSGMAPSSLARRRHAALADDNFVCRERSPLLAIAFARKPAGVPRLARPGAGDGCIRHEGHDDDCGY